MADDAISLRNRFAMVKGAWDENLRGVAFPSLGEGTAEQKIERLELALVDEMRDRATPESAEQVADAMWSLVHNRDDCGPGQAARDASTTRTWRGSATAACGEGGPLRHLRAPEARAHAAAARSFSMCLRHRTEPERYPKYPRLPVRGCAGYSIVSGSTSTR